MVGAILLDSDVTACGKVVDFESDDTTLQGPELIRQFANCGNHADE